MTLSSPPRMRLWYPSSLQVPGARRESRLPRWAEHRRERSCLSIRSESVSFMLERAAQKVGEHTGVDVARTCAVDQKVWVLAGESLGESSDA